MSIALVFDRCRSLGGFGLTVSAAFSLAHSEALRLAYILASVLTVGISNCRLRIECFLGFSRDLPVYSRGFLKEAEAQAHFEAVECLGLTDGKMTEIFY